MICNDEKLLSECDDFFSLITLNCQQFIQSYSIVEASIHQDKENYEYLCFNDFLHCCFTKSCKSLLAIQNLLLNKFPEDALIVLRSVYENYLHISYVLANPDKIDDLVKKIIGAKLGYFKHPLSKKGKPIKNKIIDPTTDEILDFGIFINDLVEGGKYEIDKQIHTILYPFLCELVHFNMITAGNYRDPENEWKFSYANENNCLQSYTTALYIGILILTEFSYFEDISPEDEENLILTICEIVSFIISLLEKFDYYKEWGDYKELFKKRLFMLKLPDVEIFEAV